MTARQQAVTWGRRLAAMTWKEILQLSRDVPLLLFLLYSFSLSVVVSGARITNGKVGPNASGGPSTTAGRCDAGSPGWGLPKSTSHRSSIDAISH